MVYQSEIRLEDLDIAKDKYNKLEMAYTTYVWWILALNTSLLSMITIIKDVILINKPIQTIFIVKTCIVLSNLIIMANLYTKFNYRTLMMMRKHHYMAYKTHVKWLIPLVALTTMSILLFIANDFFFIYWRVCSFDKL